MKIRSQRCDINRPRPVVYINGGSGPKNPKSKTQIS